MTQSDQNNYAFSAYTSMITIFGAGVCVYCISIFDLQRVNWEYFFVSLISIVIGVSVSIGIKKARLSVSVADAFTFLVFLLYGAAPAVLLSTVEAFVTSSRHTKKRSIQLFNSAVLPISFFLSFTAAELLVDRTQLFEGTSLKWNALVLVLIAAAAHYFINTLLIAASSALRSDKSIIEVWKDQYPWMVIPFLASGSIALVGAGLINAAGFLAFIVVLPIVGVLYFAYLGHHEKLEAVTAQAEQAESHLKEMTASEERFRSAFNNAPIGIGLLSNDGTWIEANDALCRIFGYSEAEFSERSLADLVHSEDLVQFLNEIGKVIQRKKQMFQAELRYINSKNEEIWTLTSVSWLHASEDSRLICQIQDISARRKAEEKLRHDAFFDSLTDLSNHNLFLGRLSDSLARAQAEGHPFVVIFVDLDRFKLINDSLGHRIGDRLLAAVGQRLKKCVPPGGVAARFGSDEFFVLIDGFPGDEGLAHLLEEIQKQISLVYNVGGQEITISASLGVVRFNEDHKSAEDVLRDADTALHIAKKQGRAKSVVFDDAMRAHSLHQIHLEKELIGAIDRNELYLAYQPIIELRTGAIRGFEALARWRHPELGDISPGDFIPIAEETGNIIKIGAFVLDQACRQLRAWRDSFGTDFELSMSVNVSARQLLQKSFLSSVIETIERHAIPPNCLKLEITESVIVENTDVIISILKQLRAMGVSLSLDDFGTGYSSLSYLHRLPIDTLKIDRSFVYRMTDKAESAEIVRTIAVLAKNLKLDIVAEGIETEAQFESLDSLGCKYGQGYLFSKPLDVEKATEFIRVGRSSEPRALYTTSVNQSHLLIEN